MVLSPRRALTANDPITAEPCTGYWVLDPRFLQLPDTDKATPSRSFLRTTKSNSIQLFWDLLAPDSYTYSSYLLMAGAVRKRIGYS
jgi:hypothetical protein